jgi:hypothetical protein
MIVILIIILMVFIIILIISIFSMIMKIVILEKKKIDLPFYKMSDAKRMIKHRVMMQAKEAMEAQMLDQAKATQTLYGTSQPLPLSWLL